MIITVYSFAGGNGQSTTVAILAALLSRRDHRVLVVDFSLNAPAQPHYLRPLSPDLSEAEGVADMLCGLLDSDKPPPAWRRYVTPAKPGRHPPTEANLARAALCTIQLADVLLTLARSDEHTMAATADVLRRTQHARARFPFDRHPVTVVPLLSKLDTSNGTRIVRWLEKFATTFEPFTDSWLPADIALTDVAGSLVLPYDKTLIGTSAWPAAGNIPESNSVANQLSTLADLLVSEMSAVELLLWAHRPLPPTGPARMVELAHRVVSIRSSLSVTHGREPTAAEVAAALGLHENEVVQFMSSGLADFAEEAELFAATDATWFSQLRDQLQHVLQTLSEREAGVVRLRFGLTDGQPRTFEEIGKIYGVTRERILQIESKTMSRLRHPSRSQVLRDYLD